jgi:DNA-binding NtrC family response regulator
LTEVIRTNFQALKGIQLEIRPDCLDIFSLLQRKQIAVRLFHLGAQDNVTDLAQIVRKVTTDHPGATVVLSDQDQNQHAVEFLRAGATDYFEIKTDLCRLRNFLEMAGLGVGTCASSSGKPSSSSSGANPFSYVVSSEMTEMMDQVRRVAPQNTTLFLSGETGTGKTQLARFIHELSPRRGEPFQVVDCGALSADLMESEIFGHQKGAFTGAICDRIGKFGTVGRGTLLLDEVNSLTPHLQSKLLRAVDDRLYEPVGSNKTSFLEARIIAAANVPLEEAVRSGKFRQDLFYRLNVVGFFLPPLRERRKLIRPLANKLLAEFVARNQLEVTGFSQEAMEILVEHDWPGNVRELRNTIERAGLLAPGPEIQKCDLAGIFQSREKLVPDFANEPAGAPPLAQTREEAEIQLIIAALDKHKNNRLRAAEELGISRMSLYNKMHRYGLFSRKTNRKDLRIIA